MVVDDDLSSINLLTGYGQRMPQLQLASTETNSLRALQYLNRNQVDLLITDVEMPHMSGIELVQALHPKPLVILVTAHDRFAVDGFDIEAIDFIRKPPAFDRFARAVHRANQLLGHGPSSQIPIEEPERDYMYLPCERRNMYRRVDFDQIIYVESSGNNSRISLLNEEVLEYRIGISIMEDRLPARDFLRVHRGFIINLGLIRGVESKNTVRMVGANKIIPIGEYYAKDFKQIWKKLIR